MEILACIIQVNLYALSITISVDLLYGIARAFLSLSLSPSLEFSVDEETDTLDGQSGGHLNACLYSRDEKRFQSMRFISVFASIRNARTHKMLMA